MKNGESIMDKLNDIIGGEKELILLKGQCINPAKVKKKEGNGTYYTFGIKTIKKSGTDEYSQGYNTYQVIVTEEKSKTFTDEQIAGFKNNEVLVLLQPSCHIKKIGENAKVNNLTLYLEDIMQTREIKRQLIESKAVKL